MGYADRGFGVWAGMGKFSIMNDPGQPGSLLKFRRGCQGVRAVQKVDGAKAYLGTDSEWMTHEVQD